MTAGDLTRLFQFNIYVLHKNLEGITHEESLVTPPAGGNSINWILGHIIYTRDNMITMLGRDSSWENIDATPYKRGSGKLTADSAVQLEKLVEMLAISQVEIEAVLKRREKILSRQASGDVLIGTEETWGNRISYYACHDAYHSGQIGMLRRFLGKPGTI